MGQKRLVGDDFGRFKQKVIVNQESGCWEWVGASDGHGYGHFWFRGSIQKAHRVSLALHGVEIPSGLWALHKCDNPPCVNPDHLFIGDRADNMKDMSKKGRQVFQVSPEKVAKGVKHSMSKLKEEDVIDIINRVKQGQSLTEVAKIFSVSKSLIWHIKEGRLWKHIYHGIDKENPRAEIEIRAL